MDHTFANVGRSMDHTLASAPRSIRDSFTRAATRKRQSNGKHCE
jgi:hypothetical protein